MTSRIRALYATAPWLWRLVIIALVGNVAGWLLIGTLPDEAYYWVWSQRLQAGYYDHPPLIAWMIRPFTEFFGDSGWALRLPSVLGWFVGAAVAWDAAQRLYGDRRAALVAVVIWSSLPIVQIGFHVNTPDTPLVLFTWLAFYFALRAVEAGRVGLWIATGVCAGLALAGKYPGVLVPAALLLGLAATPSGRATLASRGPWLGALAALLIFAPVVIWNWRNDWISFAFQLHHGVSAKPDGEPAAMLMQFLAGQWAAVLPWTWMVMALAALPFRGQLSRLGATRFWLLAAGFWLPLVVFGLAGLTAKSHPNWPVSAYVPGTLLLAGMLNSWLAQGGRGRRRVVAGSFLFGVLLVSLLRFPQWIHALPMELPPQRTQLSQTYGWDEAGQVLKQMTMGKAHCVVLGDRLQTTAMAALILDDADRVAVSDATRFNQFHLWQRQHPIPPGDLCLYFAQYEQQEAIPQSIDLGEQGRWRLARVVVHRNPDDSVRRSAFFVPE